MPFLNGTPEKGDVDTGRESEVCQKEVEISDDVVAVRAHVDTSMKPEFQAFFPEETATLPAWAAAENPEFDHFFPPESTVAAKRTIPGSDPPVIETSQSASAGSNGAQGRTERSLAPGITPPSQFGP